MRFDRRSFETALGPFAIASIQKAHRDSQRQRRTIVEVRFGCLLDSAAGRSWNTEDREMPRLGAQLVNELPVTCC